MTTTLLGIETSCDECSASVVRSRRSRPIGGVGVSSKQLEVLSVATFSQVGIHRPYGGVVPEIASRNHLETVNFMVDQALESTKGGPIPLSEVDAIAVTNRPGLVGALLVGVSAAKAIAYSLKKPLIAVHHLEGHAASLFLDQPRISEIRYPMLIAVVSGGHTNLYVAKAPPEKWSSTFLKESLVARSRDDAAGEAFDKTAKILGFPYPGGVWIDKSSRGGDPSAFNFPRALPQKDVLDYSFSGLKTSVALTVEKLKKEKILDSKMADLCASIQEAIVDALLSKIFLAIEQYQCVSIAIVGGVAANTRLRAKLENEWNRRGLVAAPFFPKSEYCTDNAAMIAAAGMFRFRQGHVLSDSALLTLNAIPNPEI